MRHPLRRVRELVRTVLGELSPSFGRMYAGEGRPSVPPEQLLSALLLQVIEPAPTTCLCCGGARLRKLSEDVTETLEVVPRSWKVIQHVREKFTCRDCEKISQAPAPFHVVPRGWAGPGLLAMILFEKFGHPSRASSTMAASAPRTMRRNERCAVSPSAVSHGSSPGPTEVAGEPPSCTA